MLDERPTFDRGLLFMLDPGGQVLSFRAGFGYDTEQLDRCQRTSFVLADQAGSLVDALRRKNPIHVTDIEVLRAQMSPEGADFVRALGSQAFVCCPVVLEDQTVGVIVVDNARSGRPLVRSDINFLMVELVAEPADTSAVCAGQPA